MENYQYIRNLKIGPMKMDVQQDSCFSVILEFYPNPLAGTLPLESHSDIGRQMLEMIDAVQMAKQPEKFLRTQDRKYGDPSNN